MPKTEEETYGFIELYFPEQEEHMFATQAEQWSACLLYTSYGDCLLAVLDKVFILFLPSIHIISSFLS